MILMLFNVFLFIFEIVAFWVKCLYIFGQQIVKYFSPQIRKQIDGNIILITGAGSGIGRALAIRLAQLNAIIVLWDIDRVWDQTLRQTIPIIGLLLRIRWKSQPNRYEEMAESHIR